MALGPNALLARPRDRKLGLVPQLPQRRSAATRQYAFPRADMQKACEDWEVHEFAGRSSAHPATRRV
jgi:hypothetical protein